MHGYLLKKRFDEVSLSKIRNFFTIIYFVCEWVSDCDTKFDWELTQSMQKREEEENKQIEDAGEWKEIFWVNNISAPIYKVHHIT